MKIVSVADMKAHLSTYIKESKEGPVIITKNGKPSAVLLAVADEEELERLILAYSPKFQAILAASRQEIRETGGMSHEAFWQQVEAETEPEHSRLAQEAAKLDPAYEQALAEEGLVQDVEEWPEY